MRFAPVLVTLVALVILTALTTLAGSAWADGGAPNVAYVAGTQGGISTIDIAKQQVTGAIGVGGDPRTILLSIDGSALYVTQPALGRVAAIETASGRVRCSIALAGQPSLLALDPGTGTLYAAGNGAADVTGIDPATCKVRATLPTGGAVYGLAVAVIGSGVGGGLGNQLWVATSHALRVFTGNDRALFTIALAREPRYLCIPPGTTVYFTTQQGAVMAIDLATRRTLPALLTGGVYGAMDYDALTGKVYVPDTRHNRVDVLAPVGSGSTSAPPEPAYVYTFASAPQSIAITSDGQLGFVALARGTVVMLDIPGRQQVVTYHVGGSPRFIITGLYPLSNGSPGSSTTHAATPNLTAIAAIGGAVVLVVTALMLTLARMRARQQR